MKKLLSPFIILLCLFSFGFICSAEGNSSEIDKIYDDIYNFVDDDTRELLKSIGVDEIDLANLKELSFKDFFECIRKTAKESIGDIAKPCMTVIALIGLMSVLGNIIQNSLCNDIFVILTVCILSGEVMKCFELFANTFSLSGKFMLCLLPVVTFLLSATGSITFSGIYSSAIIAFSQLLSALGGNILIPVFSMYTALIICFSLNESIHIGSISDKINRVLFGIIKVASTAFTLILTIKNSLSKSLNSVVMKTAKSIITDIIPIVGSASSAAINSVIGAFSVAKGTIGIFGIITVILINLPSLVRLSVLCIMFFVLSIICDFSNLKRTDEFITAFRAILKMMFAVEFFQMLTLIISIGLSIILRGEQA